MTTKYHPLTQPTTARPLTVSTSRRAPAALGVVGFLAALLPFNTYWGLGGTWGLAWILGCDCTVPLALVWAQQAAVIAGIAVVAGRAGIWHIPLPRWVLRAGIWSMALVFGAVGLTNLVGDNTAQARFLFAPVALVLCVLCVRVARDRPTR